MSNRGRWNPVQDTALCYYVEENSKIPRTGKTPKGDFWQRAAEKVTYAFPMKKRNAGACQKRWARLCEEKEATKIQEQPAPMNTQSGQLPFPQPLRIDKSDLARFQEATRLMAKTAGAALEMEALKAENAMLLAKGESLANGNGPDQFREVLVRYGLEKAQ